MGTIESLLFFFAGTMYLINNRVEEKLKSAQHTHGVVEPVV